jgi:hypothetical protein
MCNHTAVAKAFVTAACALAIALLTIGMGVNSLWVGSDQHALLNDDSAQTLTGLPPPAAAGHPRLSILTSNQGAQRTRAHLGHLVRATPYPFHRVALCLPNNTPIDCDAFGSGCCECCGRNSSSGTLECQAC